MPRGGRLRELDEQAEVCPARPISIRQMDATAIYRGLYQGGLRRFSECSIAVKDADVVVVLAPDALVKVKHPRPILIGLDDSPSDLRRIDELHSLAAGLAERVADGQRVLVLCHEGRNRSGLLVGLILWTLGFVGRDAVRLIKSKRRNALSNHHFTRYLAALS